MAMKLSNKLIAALNTITFLASIPIIAGGIWLSNQSHAECGRFLQKPIICIGISILLISMAGILGSSFSRSNWLLWMYLLVMFFVIALLLFSTVSAFVVTNKGACEAISGKGYKGFRLGDCSDWLRNRVDGNWDRIRGCLIDGEICPRLHGEGQFSRHYLSGLRLGCCEPPAGCNSTGAAQASACGGWSDDGNALCYGCESCKAAVLDGVGAGWRKLAAVEIAIAFFLVVVYSVGCCALRNGEERRKDGGGAVVYRRREVGEEGVPWIEFKI